MKKETLNDFLNEININKTEIAIIKNKYGIEMPSDVEKIISCEEGKLFLDDWRFLSRREMLNADEFLNYSFLMKKQLPIVDTFDNDFIVYDATKEAYILLNIVDECEFGQGKQLLDFAE